MLKVDVYNMNGEIVGQTELNENIFNIEVNRNAMYAVVKNQLANKRQGTQSAKTRAEVSGGGAKPWRQKGTGRARQGSTRAPQWIKGGVVFAPKPRDHSYTVPKKVRRLALKSALTSKQINDGIVVLDELTFEDFKTSRFTKMLKDLNVEGSAMLVLSSPDLKIEKSSRNIPGIKTSLVNTINTYDILKYSKFIITRDALEKVVEVYEQ
jgi:large subunit ribosomal protein L4